MKLLIIAHGTSLDSTLAMVTDMPAWYLVVDVTLWTVHVLNPTGQPNLNAAAEAIAQGVRVLITDSDDSHTRVRTASGLTSVALSGGLTVKEAIRSWETGRLGMSGNTPKEMHQEAKSEANWRKRRVSPPSIHTKTKDFARGPTPRGRHHLQQYAGRGH